jgi:hypothetical protein
MKKGIVILCSRDQPVKMTKRSWIEVHRRACSATKIESNLDPTIDALSGKVQGFDRTANGLIRSGHAAADEL